MPRTLFGICDEASHLMTAGLLLSAWVVLRNSRYRRGFVALMLAATVLIDLDHVPNELFGITVLTQETHRPYSHSLLIVVVAAIGALVLPSRHRAAASAVAAGASCHLLRDLATGGVPLLWPVNHGTIRAPHLLYLALLLIAAILPVPARRTEEAPGSPEPTERKANLSLPD